MAKNVIRQTFKNLDAGFWCFWLFQRQRAEHHFQVSFFNFVILTVMWFISVADVNTTELEMNFYARKANTSGYFDQLEEVVSNLTGIFITP